MDKFEQRHEKVLDVVNTSDQVPDVYRERLKDVLQDIDTMKIISEYLPTPEKFLEYMINRNQKYQKSPMFLTSLQLQTLFANFHQGIFS